MSIPIIFTHTNNSLYLQLALLQAKKACGDCVFLIGDQSNGADFVRHYNLCDYENSQLGLEFQNNYKHRSPNPYKYELFCLKRWFVALEFLQKNNLPECFCVDSDVLIYKNLNELSGALKDFDFSVIRYTGEFAGPQCCYFKREALERYCKFILKMYRDDFAKLQAIYEGFQKKGYVSGLSDMVLLAEFCKANPEKFIDFDYSPERGFCFDENVGLSYGFEVKGGLKKIRLANGVPSIKRLDSGKSVDFWMLHFQGNYKPCMKKYSTLTFAERRRSPYYNKLLAKTCAKDFCKKILSLAPKGLQDKAKAFLKKSRE